MGDLSAQDEAAAAQAAALIARRLDDRLGTTTTSIQELLVNEISELGGDVQLVQLLRDTVAVNVDAFFSAVRNAIPVRNLEPPSAALEYARRLAQREVSVNALVRAYRLGHQAALDVVLDEIRKSDLDPKLSLHVYELMADISFEYIDWISQRVVAAYQDERERWLENRNNLRALKVRELLSGADVDIDAMTTAVRYPLKRIHLAVVLWCDEHHSDALASMEKFVRKLSESVGAREAPLFVSVDHVTAWAWIPMRPDAASSAVAQVRACAEKAPDGPHIAIGEPLADVDGFRRSHRQALDIQVVAAAAGQNARRAYAFSDPGLSVAALLGRDVGAAAQWVNDVLGPLASRSENDERLRETLLMFLRSGSSYTAAADELHLHHNSVKYRVQRAADRRGRPIADDRLDVEVALLLCHWFGAAVLS